MHVGQRDDDGGADASTGFVPSPDATTADDAALPPALRMCIATDCPESYATCDFSADRCRTNLSNDIENCGACGNKCPSFLYEPGGGIGTDIRHLLPRCAEGKCLAECRTDWQDCNGLIDDGCEVNISGNPDHCGACGKKCAPGVPCIVTNTGQSQCGCGGGLTYCPSTGACVDLSNDDRNCRECDNQCNPRPEEAPPPPPHSHYGCVASTCQADPSHLKCDDLGSLRWADCDGDLTHADSNGCETTVGNIPGTLFGDVNNCGACGTKCSPGQECTFLKDGTFGCVCGPGETLCSSYRGKWCANLLTDANDCGACGNPCVRDPGKNLLGMCRKGVCVDECSPDWGDCDGDPTNGCETNLKTNIMHCGACGARCDTAAGQPCVDGVCLMTPCDGDGGTLPK
jgi:hypothetical protein